MGQIMVVPAIILAASLITKQSQSIIDALPS